MPSPLDTDTISEIMALASTGLSQRKIGVAVGVAQSTVNKVLQDNALPAPAGQSTARVALALPNGIVVVASDAHYWPGETTTAHRGVVKMISILRPNAVILNGDAFDGARVSRHASIGWERRPKVWEELEVAQKRLSEIETRAVAEDVDHLIWTLGNHDMRFETRLAAVAPEYENIPGFHLKDHFPDWTPAWSCWINNNTVVKHRWKGGIHAAYNNTVQSGLSIVTGHTHRLLATPFADYRGLRWGIECGTLAEPYGPQFVDYTEDAPTNWQSGFLVLTYRDGNLLPPEFVHVVGDGTVAFRGEQFYV